MLEILLVSLGPIQDFIASARRCQDLWFGSWMLSDLARASAEAIEGEGGTTSLVFPGALGNDKVAVANKILAVVPQGRASFAALKGELAMRARLVTLSNAAFDRVGQQHLHRPLAEAQVRDLIEYVWVTVLMSSEADYARAREQAEEWLAVRKNTRTWGSVPWVQAAGVPKSTLDGQRESVLDEQLYKNLKNSQVTAQDVRRRYFVKPAERLCGVGLLKRVGCEFGRDEETGELEATNDRPAFHSTSHVTSQPLLARISRLGKRAAVETYVERLLGLGIDTTRCRIRCGQEEMATLHDPFTNAQATVDRTHVQNRKVGIDGYVFYEGRLRELCEEYGPGVESVDEARKALRTCLDALGTSEPCPYYGVLLADGDKMGDAIGRLATRGVEEHRKLSRALDQFALGARTTVEQHSGSLVYSGGDDVLALLPLHTALECAEALQKDFFDKLAAIVPDKTPTLSVGIGVAHHLDPMGEARALAKSAEKQAKEAGRNRLTLIASKRSGGQIRATVPWSDPQPLPGRIRQWVRWLEQDLLPDGLAFELEDMLRPLGESPSADLLGSLAARIVDRKRAKQGTEALSKEVEAAIRARIKDRASVTLLSEEIRLARLFHSAYAQAFIGGQP